MKLILMVLCSFFVFASCTKKNEVAENVPNPAVAPANALADAEQAARLTPNFETLINYGLELTKTKKHELAAAEYLKAAQLSPHSPIPWNNICSEYIEMLRFVSAKEACETAIQKDANFDLAKNNLAVAKAGIANNLKLIEKAKSEIKKDNRDETMVQVGLIYYTIGDYDQAIKSWIDIKPKSKVYATASNNLGSAYIIQKKYDLADKAIGEALKLEPKNELFLNNKAWLESARK